jgi:phosphatidylserine/phosphatidylglycerophosphate/cardiolipin synthase-like enzyme
VNALSMFVRHSTCAAAVYTALALGCSSTSPTHPGTTIGADSGVGHGPDSGKTMDGAVAGDSSTTQRPDGATPTQGDSGQQDSSGPTPASSGITITVEPDGSGDAQGLLTAMQGAQAAVHMEMYLLTNATYISALEALHSRGIDVKVILNQSFPSGTSSADTNESSYPELQGAGVDVQWAPTTTGFTNYTHEKAVIIDPGTPQAEVWIMTMNLDTDAPKYNREFLAQDTNAPDVHEAEAIFEADYAAMSFTPAGDLIVAPSPQNNAQPALLDLINGATSSIDVESEEYDASGLEMAIADALESKAKAGVTVHMVLETSTEATQTSAASALQAAGGQVVGYTYTGTSSLDIHAKAIVVDGTRAYVGSENLSGGSLGYNRELGVLLTEPSEVAKVVSAIENDFNGGTTYQ